MTTTHEPFKCQLPEPCADCMALINDVPTCGRCDADYYCHVHVGPAIAALNFKPVGRPRTVEPTEAEWSAARDWAKEHLQLLRSGPPLKIEEELAWLLARRRQEAP